MRTFRASAGKDDLSSSDYFLASGTAGMYSSEGKTAYGVCVFPTDSNQAFSQLSLPTPSG